MKQKKKNKHFIKVGNNKNLTYYNVNNLRCTDIKFIKFVNFTLSIYFMEEANSCVTNKNNKNIQFVLGHGTPMFGFYTAVSLE